jgi:hypothetical protein
MSGCGPGTTTGNPLNPDKGGTISGTSIVLVSKNNSAFFKQFSDALIPNAFASSSNVKFCFKRLRLKNDKTDSPEYDLLIGEKLIDTQKTTLLNMNLPSGDYDRIEFDLERDCVGNTPKPSVSFTNDFGTFSTNADIRIRFEGSFKVRSNSELELNIAPLISALNQVQSNSAISSGLENATGTD